VYFPIVEGIVNISYPGVTLGIDVVLAPVTIVKESTGHLVGSEEETYRL